MFASVIKAYSVLLLIFLLYLLPASAKGQAYQGYIYGEVTMVDDKKYEGVIQWSNNELSWHDIFTATKKENKVLGFLSAGEIKRLSEEEKAEKSDWGFMRLWENKYPSKKHTFECYFGYIRALRVTGDQSARVTLKDGQTVEVAGEEDTGENIYILDKTGRRSKLAWEQIQTVVFKNTPEEAFVPAVVPLYGTLVTDFGEFTGFIGWDLDESLNIHYLDGKDDGKKKAIQFSQISQIEKIEENTCRVTLLTGEKIDLSDTDDVGESNHGILIQNKQTGTIEINWNDFQKVTFTQTIPQAAAYHAYKKPKPLSGKIKTTEGTLLQGKLIFDLDESMDIELLKGKSGDLMHYIPFKDISSISRKNYKYTGLTLRNGHKLVLTGSTDVTDKNWGILILNGADKPTYVPWNKIEYITFTN